MSDYSNLIVYKKSYDLAMDVFEVTRDFPREEKYSLTDQVRRSSRSISAQIAESYAKRQYPKHFVAKLSDADAENNETKNWIRFALSCGYIDSDTHSRLTGLSGEVGRLLNYMIRNPHKFINTIKPNKTN